MEHTIDAKGRSLGRVASEAAMILMGKNHPSFERNKITNNLVNIVNASKTKISPKKLKTKEYIRYSGYPGGLKAEKMTKVIDKKGFKEIYELAVYGMIPANKLRKEIMKNLTIVE